MKYPLATISRLMEIFPEKFLYGYDIHCAFTKILKQSTLGPLVERCGVEGVIPSFHGHAHNRLCQVQHHPKYKVGAGKEDFERCERIFSESNALASATCNASDFHRHQAIDKHFKFSDVEKYASLGKHQVLFCQLRLICILGTFLYKNYVQCLEIIHTETMFSCHTDLTDVDFDAELQEEWRYLMNATTKKDDDTVQFEYVKALGELDEAE